MTIGLRKKSENQMPLLEAGLRIAAIGQISPKVFSFQEKS
jgi:hypothetical protein